VQQQGLTTLLHEKSSVRAERVIYVRIVTCFLGCSLSDSHGIAALVQHVLNFVQGDEVGGAGEGDLWGV
jgi:hypothetical protein